MSVRWEYLVVAWNLTAKPPVAPSEAWELVGTFQLSRPGGAEVETRSYDAKQSSTMALDVLNELGADAWELVSNVVERSTLAPAQGYQNVGVAIASTQIFKRPAD
ncbi:MAG: hypothetical protein ACRDLP_15650 [Solirubrobacteraceae bacterium]